MNNIPIFEIYTYKLETMLVLLNQHTEIVQFLHLHLSECIFFIIFRQYPTAKYCILFNFIFKYFIFCQIQQ